MSGFKKYLIALCFILLGTQHSKAQELERKPLLGIAYDVAQELVKKDLPLGVEVKYIVPQSSAQKADLQEGDIVVKYNGHPINQKSDFKTQMRDQHTGDNIKLTLIRNGVVMKKEMVLTEFPRETNPAFHTIYDQVKSGENIIRTLLTKPKQKQDKYPAVYIIQGIGCSRMENPFHNDSGIYSLVDSLTQGGFVTMRMERTGVGDSQGMPCQSVDFKSDLSNFKQGLKKLKTYDYVDTEKVFIVGISMGGIMAPILANEIEVAGLVIYGTGGKDWYSYELENTFRQALLEDMPFEELNDFMKQEQLRLHYFFSEKKTPDEIKKIDLEMGKRCEAYPLHYSYFQSVADLDLYRIWSQCSTKVMAIHGHSDFVSSGAEHQLIAEMVNHKNPGKGAYKEFPEADHWMLKTANEKASLQKKTAGINNELIAFMKNWIVDQGKGEGVGKVKG